MIIQPVIHQLHLFCIHFYHHVKLLLIITYTITMTFCKQLTITSVIIHLLLLYYKQLIHPSTTPHLSCLLLPIQPSSYLFLQQVLQPVNTHLFGQILSNFLSNKSIPHHHHRPRYYPKPSVFVKMKYFQQLQK